MGRITLIRRRNVGEIDGFLIKKLNLRRVRIKVMLNHIYVEVLRAPGTKWAQFAITSAAIMALGIVRLMMFGVMFEGYVPGIMIWACCDACLSYCNSYYTNLTAKLGQDIFCAIYEGAMRRFAMRTPNEQIREKYEFDEVVGDAADAMMQMVKSWFMLVNYALLTISFIAYVGYVNDIFGSISSFIIVVVICVGAYGKHMTIAPRPNVEDLRADRRFISSMYVDDTVNGRANVNIAAILRLVRSILCAENNIDIQLDREKDRINIIVLVIIVGYYIGGSMTNISGGFIAIQMFIEIKRFLTYLTVEITYWSRLHGMIGELARFWPSTATELKCSKTISAANIIAINDMTYDIVGLKWIGKPLIIDVMRRSVIQVCGKNGAGKSSFIDMFCGNVIADVKMTADGVLVTPSAIVALRMLVRQDDKIETQNRSWAELIGGPYDGVDERLVRELITVVGLSRKFGENGSISAKLARPSGGEQRRIAIARGMYMARMTGARILILDEPDAGIDDSFSDMFLRIVHFHIGPIIVVVNGTHTLPHVDQRVMIENGGICVVD
jgi:ABC-type Mn2+/Zn2+ transport system ATPase subunit